MHIITMRAPRAAQGTWGSNCAVHAQFLAKNQPVSFFWLMLPQFFSRSQPLLNELLQEGNRSTFLTLLDNAVGQRDTGATSLPTPLNSEPANGGVELPWHDGKVMTWRVRLMEGEGGG